MSHFVVFYLSVAATILVFTLKNTQDPDLRSFDGVLILSVLTFGFWLPILIWAIVKKLRAK